MNGTEMFWVLLNALGAFSAIFANLAGARWGLKLLSPLRVAAASLASFYFIGYIYLLGSNNVTGWSHFYRRVAIVSWIFIWILPPIFSIRAQRKVAAQIVEIVNKDSVT